MRPTVRPAPKLRASLNDGTSNMKPPCFPIKVMRKLKGLDARTAKRFEEKLKT